MTDDDYTARLGASRGITESVSKKDEGYKRVAAMVIRTAVDDFREASKKRMTGLESCMPALREFFFRDPWFENICALAGINPEMVRDALKGDDRGMRFNLSSKQAAFCLDVTYDDLKELVKGGAVRTVIMEKQTMTESGLKIKKWAMYNAWDIENLMKLKEKGVNIMKFAVSKEGETV